MKTKCNFTPILIGGLPRSGTSMLMRVLDGHSRLVVLPREGSFIEQYSFGKLSDYASVNELLNLPELVFADENKYGELISRARGDHRKNLLRLNTALFRAEFLRVMNNNSYSHILPKMFDALAGAFIKSHPALADTMNAKHFVVKIPFFAERMFADLSMIMPSSKLIYIRRNAEERYASSAVRVERTKSRSPKKLDFDYFTFQFLLNVTSEYYLKRAMVKMPANVMEISYEDFCLRFNAYQDKLCDFMGIEYEHIFNKLTYLGCEMHETGSSYGFKKSIPSLHALPEDAIEKFKNELAALRTGLDLVLADIIDVGKLELFRKLISVSFYHDDEHGLHKRIEFFNGLQPENFNHRFLSGIFIKSLKKPTNLL